MQGRRTSAILKLNKELEHYSIFQFVHFVCSSYSHLDACNIVKNEINGGNFSDLARGNKQAQITEGKKVHSDY